MKKRFHGIEETTRPQKNDESMKSTAEKSAALSMRPMVPSKVMKVAVQESR